MTKALEAAVKARMVELGGESAAHAPSVAVRLVSCVPQSLRVQGMLRKHFVGPGGAELPEAIPFESRSVVLFQKNDGVDLCVFSMYVHEFGDSCGPSAKRVYVAYLDSVEYFRPRTARTEVYHELLVAYLDWSRRRGFTAAHIWACPPQRGNNFIFWCHPTHQRTPSRERLTEWYRAMVRRAVETGAVSRVASLYDEYLAAVDTMRRRHKPGDRKRNPAWVDKLEKPPAKKDDEKKDEASCRDAASPDPNPQGAPSRRAAPKSQSSEAPACPPLFDGDYWPRKRRVSAHDHFVNLLKHVVQQPSSYPFMAPVDAEALGLADYHDVVKAPMDLGTVERRLGGGSYANPQKLVDDVRLTFANAQKYNPPAHPVHEAATHLGCVFEKKLQNLLQRLKSAGQLDDARKFLREFPLSGAAAAAPDRGAPPPPPPPSAPSLRARLLPELASSVHKMKDSQFVLYLQPDERPPTEPGAPARRSRKAPRPSTTPTPTRA
ncbi:histone acetyltransferase [Aureococcus anophagefferens]|nr:histone acetyltransferase [Aureococcus anophagefferens]